MVYVDCLVCLAFSGVMVVVLVAGWDNCLALWLLSSQVNSGSLWCGVVC